MFSPPDAFTSPWNSDFVFHRLKWMIDAVAEGKKELFWSPVLTYPVQNSEYDIGIHADCAERLHNRCSVGRKRDGNVARTGREEGRGLTRRGALCRMGAVERGLIEREGGRETALSLSLSRPLSLGPTDSDWRA